MLRVIVWIGIYGSEWHKRVVRVRMRMRVLCHIGRIGEQCSGRMRIGVYVYG